MASAMQDMLLTQLSATYLLNYLLSASCW